jgi:catechol 2,3-dioxygenase-like lactoylglutathione lyase family enzyme
VQLPNRIGLITLACRDVERMAAFFRGLGWPEAPSSDEHYRVFQLENGVVLALWGAEHYVSSQGERADGFRGFTLGLNVGSWEELEAVHAALRGAGGLEELEEVQHADWGGGFTFRDPEGNLWEIAFAEGTSVGENGALTWF